MKLRLYFNPRSREGSDMLGEDIPDEPILISIHAPAKGATCFLQSMLYHLSISIHAPAKGATKVWMEKILLNRFQSTLPRRERLSTPLVVVHVQHFNPRSREGSDTAFTFPEKTIIISIHAPAKGATDARD